MAAMPMVSGLTLTLPTIVLLFFGSVYFAANMPTATAWL